MIITALRVLGLRILDAIDTWVIEMHEPADPALPCPHHWRSTPWPCPEFIEATERRHARRTGAPIGHRHPDR